MTVGEFDAVDFEAALLDGSKVDPNALQGQYDKLARDAEANQEHRAVRVYQLLSSVCGIHLKPEDRAEPWGPMAVFDNRRSAIPSDFKGEQSANFITIIDRIKNPGLRARLADIAWTNDRKVAGRAAAVAADAYKECADGLLAGKFKPYLDGDRASFEALKNVQHAFAIARSTTKKDAKGRTLFSDTLKATALNLYAAAKNTNEYVVFLQIAELALYYELIEPIAISKDCEDLAATKNEQFTLPVKNLWNLAARLHRNTNDKGAEPRCLLAAVQRDARHAQTAQHGWRGGTLGTSGLAGAAPR